MQQMPRFRLVVCSSLTLATSQSGKRGRVMSVERTRQINALFKELEKAITSQMNATKRVRAITAQIDAAQAEERRAVTKAKREARGKS